MSGRFRPHRLGVVGLYEYADQEFRLEEGRLALRGRNTSGKSKALELLVPFVLDGDITPRKLDPFASSAKTMRWNLIECTDAHPQRRAGKRIGYAWAEFRAVDEDGSERFLTCGVGLEATRHTDGIKDRWYFTTPQRVGGGLQLTRAVGDGDAQPVIKGDLAEQLAAGHGALHDGPSAYKEALRAQLLPFVTAELYEQMLEVIRQLRKPKLSDSLNVTRLSTMLSQALPAVDDDLVRRLGDALEQLHELQRRHDELREARRLVGSIAEREYRAYARGLLGVRGERLRQADGAHERARAALRRSEEAHAAAVDALERAGLAEQATAAEHRRVDEEHLQLVSSDAFKVIALLDDRSREHDEARRRRDRLAVTLASSDAQLRRAQAAREEAAEGADRAGRARDEAGALLDALLPRAGLDAMALDRAALGALPGRLDVGAALRALADALAAAGQRRDDAAAAAGEADAQLDAASEQFGDALHAWRLGLTELAPDDGTIEAMAAAALAGEDPAGPVVALVEARRAELALLRARLAARREALARELAAARDERDRLARAREPEPPARLPRRASRAGRPGAPLWAVCDVRPEVAEADRGPLEAALEDAGILDAWVSPDGAIHDADVSLVAEQPPAERGAATLARLLRADPGQRALPREVVEQVLESIALEGPVSLSPGRFRLGPLHGRSAKEVPEYLGAAARAALRRRLLAEAQARIDALEGEMAAVDAQDEQHDAGLRRLEAERTAIPSADALRAAQRAARRTADRLADAEAHVEQLVAQRDRHEAQRAAAREAFAAAARAVGLPAREPALRDAARALDQAETARDAALRALEAHDAATARLRAAERDLGEAQAARAALEEDRRHADDELASAAGRLAAAQAAEGASAEELRARAGALRARREELAAGLDAAQRALVRLTGEAKDAERAASEAAGALRAADGERAAALEAVRAVGRHDLFSAALGREAAPADERASAAWTLTTALERVRTLPALEQGVDLERRARRVSDAVSALQRSLVAFDMDASTVFLDGITVVEVSRDGRRTTPAAMLEELDGELAHREQVLSAKRREVLGRALLGEIAEHLRARITDVRASVRARNETLRRCPTGAGRTVSIAWEVDEDAGAPAGVLELLGDRAAENLDAASRDALFAFLEQRIADARAGADDDVGQGRIVDHLAIALDYRRWWRFSLHLHERDGSRRRLTARTQGLGSGGEQSVLMHLPLFATAAALYDLAPGAPRIVALDEAMDGIDPPTREQVFALLVELDLDWVMTSYDLNPCVATVPQAGFYELHRDNAEWGVWAQHFVWNGREVVEVVDG